MLKSKLIFLASAVFLGGLVVGLFISPIVFPPKIETKIEAKFLRPGESPFADNIYAQIWGKITKIKSSEVLVEADDENLAISLKPKTRILIFEPSGSGGSPPVPKEASIADLRLGQEVSINLKILPDGAFEVQTISIVIR